MIGLLRDRTLWRYLLAGGSAAIVDLAVFAALSTLHEGVAVNAALSFMAAMVYNYVLASRFAFRAGLSWRRFAAFAMGAICGLSVNVGVTLLAVTAGAPILLAKTAGIGIGFVFNFAVNRLLVFRAAAAPD